MTTIADRIAERHRNTRDLKEMRKLEYRRKIPDFTKFIELAVKEYEDDILQWSFKEPYHIPLKIALKQTAREFSVDECTFIWRGHLSGEVDKFQVEGLSVKLVVFGDSNSLKKFGPKLDNFIISVRPAKKHVDDLISL